PSLSISSPSSTRFGWRMSRSARNSVLNRRIASGVGPRSVFSATCTPRSRSSARYTTPMPPSPRTSSSSNRPSPSRRGSSGLCDMLAQELQAFDHARSPELEVVVAGTEEEHVIDVAFDEDLVEVLRAVEELVLVLGAAVDVQRGLAGLDLLGE